MECWLPAAVAEVIKAALAISKFLKSLRKIVQV